MSETINIKNYDFYLNFLSDDFGLKQIDEPVGIDAINLLTESDEERYARDSYFGGDGNVKLTFTSERGSKNLGFYLDKLIEYDNRFGHNSNIEFIMKNRVTDEDFVLGKLEFEQKETDHYSYFSCNIDQLKTQAEIKRFQETKVNLFAEEDLKGNEITPVETFNVLLPAKPVNLTSEWSVTKTPFLDVSLTVDNYYFNDLASNTKYEIKNTLSFIPSAYDNNGSNFKFIEALTDLTEVKIIGTNISFVLTATFVDLYYRIGTSYGSSSEVLVGSYTPINSGLLREYENINYELDVEIPEGESLWMYFKTPEIPIINFEFSSGTQTITAVSTSVDTVTKAVRLLDATKQVAKSINPDFEVIAPRLESEGEHKNQFLATGDMIRGRESAFHLEWKDLSEYFLSEPNMDYQTVGNNIFIGKEDDYYPNIEIGAFLQKPDSTFNITYNPRFTINGLEYKFKTYNQDKDDENTIDAVHTESELLVPNDNVQDIKQIDVDFIRDHFMIGTTQVKAVTETSSSLSQDDKVFIFDCVTVAPSQTRSTKRRAIHNVNEDGNLQLLINGLNWGVLGFVVGDVLTVNNTSNAGDYTVLAIENNIVTLEPISTTPTGLGSRITEVTYPLTNVQYVLRTNEGFDSIEGVENPNEYGNLRYSIKRNLLDTRGAYLKTATKYNPEAIKVQYFKNEVPLVTQFDGGAVISEREPITQEELPEPILSPNYITCKVLCSFEDYDALKTKLETINDTDTYVKTIGGFVRICDNNGRVRKGYIKKADYKLAEGVLDLELEEKYESDIANITYSGGLYFVDEAGYDLDGTSILDYAQTDTNYIQFFDPNTLPLTNVLKYDKVSVNDVVYDSITELISAIEAL